MAGMRISKEDEIIIKDLDDLKDVLGGIPLVKEITRLYFLGRHAGKVFKTYIKSRKGLIKLLGKTMWETEDVIEAVKRGTKIYAARDYLDTLLESKEGELEKYIDHVLNLYPQLIDLSKEHLIETQRRLESNRSYISRFVSRMTRREDTIDETSIDAVSALRYVLFHPIQRYSSYGSGFSFDENLNANKRVKIMNDCRKKVFRILKKISPREFYREVAKSYNELNTLIKLADEQEKFESGEMSDLVLLDSLLKNLCPHNPPHHRGTTNPKEFLYGLMMCPNVKELISSSYSLNNKKLSNKSKPIGKRA